MRRPQVFWAGRWDRQKRIDVALEVARRMPDVDVRMWGESVLTRGHVGEAPSNVRLEGAYAHISELELSEADVWLYTSAWDGVPSQLLEVAMTGVPIVGSLVGGTGEVLDPDGSWPVAEVEDPDAYVKAIRDVLADPVQARRRSSALRERLLRERTEDAFAAHVADLLLAPEESR
jgi:glycosyltransferase involved in cell wall biosynthesis